MSMYPALYPFGSKERWLSYLKHCGVLTDKEMAAAKTLLAKKIVPVFRLSDIAQYIGISAQLVTHMALFPQKYYRTFEIPKRSGGKRSITAPRVFLKTVQRFILDCIISALPPHEAAVGFLPAKGCRFGATAHIGKKFLWNIDLKDFFPSVSREQVERIFKEAGLTEHSSHFISGLCCLEGRLPQGAPTSPALSNLVLKQLDSQIAKEAAAIQIVYTRYADDLTFSSFKPIPEKFRTHVRTVVEKAGFRINEKKTRLMGPKCRREVTGLTVNEQVSVPRHKRRMLRAYFHQISLNPAAFSAEKYKALGYTAWLKEYHQAEAQDYFLIASSIPEPEQQSGSS